MTAAAFYDVPVAIVVAVAGAVSCFAGYRLFRSVLGIVGFGLGWWLAGVAIATHSTVAAIAVGFVGGLIGAAALVFAYFIAVAIIGAGLGAVVAHVAWSLSAVGDPPWLLVVVLVVVGAIAAVSLQRYVIVVSTAFGGAWMMLIAGLAASGNRVAQASIDSHNWVLSPFATAGIADWIPIAWIGLGLLGMTVQLGVTARRKRNKKKDRAKG
jgi:Domain of unknown function (DUF4203)